MKALRTLAVVLVTIVVTIIAAAWLWTLVPSRTPDGQPPLAFIDASTLHSVREEFNRSSADTRVIVLLSPT